MPWDRVELSWISPRVFHTTMAFATYVNYSLWSGLCLYLLTLLEQYQAIQAHSPNIRGIRYFPPSLYTFLISKAWLGVDICVTTLSFSPTSRRFTQPFSLFQARPLMEVRVVVLPSFDSLLRQQSRGFEPLSLIVFHVFYGQATDYQ